MAYTNNILERPKQCSTNMENNKLVIFWIFDQFPLVFFLLNMLGCWLLPAVLNKSFSLPHGILFVFSKQFSVLWVLNYPLHFRGRCLLLTSSSLYFSTSVCVQEFMVSSAYNMLITIESQYSWVHVIPRMHCIFYRLISGNSSNTICKNAHCLWFNKAHAFAIEF